MEISEENFSILEKQIKKFIKEEGYFSVIKVNVDNFQKINNLKGKETGDALLGVLHALIKKKIRENDLFLVDKNDRQSFLLLVLTKHFTEGFFVAERLRKIVSNAIMLGIPDVTISCGVSQAYKISEVNSKDSQVIKKMLNEASDALSKAKLKKNKVIIFKEAKNK